MSHHFAWHGVQALAEDGCLLLGERLRSPQERADVVGVVEKVMNVKVSRHKGAALLSRGGGGGGSPRLRPLGPGGS